MKTRRSRSPVRLLAPLALVAVGVAVVLVYSNATVDKGQSRATPPSTATAGTTGPAGKYAHRRRYTVRTGDTLGGIAVKTGVAVTMLEDLNPGLDPQSLDVGQKIRLRE